MLPVRTGIVLGGVLAAVPLFSGACAEPIAILAKSYGPEFTLPRRPQLPDDQTSRPQVSEYDLSLGCIIGGVTGTTLSVGAGGLNVVNLIAGGLVPAASPVAAYLALGGVVFASFCAVGQALTPAVMASYGYFMRGTAIPAGRQLDARYCEASSPLSAIALRGHSVRPITSVP